MWWWRCAAGITAIHQGTSRLDGFTLAPTTGKITKTEGKKKSLSMFGKMAPHDRRTSTFRAV